MIEQQSRQVITKNALGKRHIKEVLGSTLAGLILSPQEIWLVTAWISDFDLLDNRSGNWNYLHAGWGNRFISFIELLEVAVISGCKLSLIVKKSEVNEPAIKKICNNLNNHKNFKLGITDDLHIKGLLTESCFMRGSMNFTFSGANRNEELVDFSREQTTIFDARIEFKNTYSQSFIEEAAISDSPFDKDKIETSVENEDEDDFF